MFFPPESDGGGGSWRGAGGRRGVMEGGLEGRVGWLMREEEVEERGVKSTPIST